jgi:hypothetical protein
MWTQNARFRTRSQHVSRQAASKGTGSAGLFSGTLFCTCCRAQQLGIGPSIGLLRGLLQCNNCSSGDRVNVPRISRYTSASGQVAPARWRPPAYQPGNHAIHVEPVGAAGADFTELRQAATRQHNGITAGVEFSSTVGMDAR